MLTSSRPASRRPRTPHSLKQEYEEFILQRIEEFKDQLSRPELLTLADEAVRELELESAEQLLLTELMMLEHVDRLIVRRLRLPSYRRWRVRHVKLRAAQRQPTHWGLDADTPLADLAERLEPGEPALMIGSGSVAAGLYLAALEADVLLIDRDLSVVEAAESRAAAEAVAARFQALVVNLDGWFPETTPSLVVIDPVTMAALDTSTRIRVIDLLRDRTAPGGLHCILPAEPRADVIPLAPEALQAHYHGWIVERGRGAGTRVRWFIATKA